MIHKHTPSPVLCVCMCVSVGNRDTPGRSRLCLRDLRWGETTQRMEAGREARRSPGLPAGTRPTVLKWKTIRNRRPSADKMKPHGKWGAAALMTSTRRHAACTDATPRTRTHTHTHTCTTSTRSKQMRATTTGEDKRAKCIPHVNKHRSARRCTPSATTSSLRCLGERPGVLAADGRGKMRRKEGQLGSAASRAKSDVQPPPPPHRHLQL